MKYKYSQSEVSRYDKDGIFKTFAICCACGNEYRNHFGFEIHYQMPKNCLHSRRGFCTKCSNKIIPIIHDALEKIHTVEHNIRQSVPAEIKKARENETKKFWKRLAKNLEEGRATWTIKEN